MEPGEALTSIASIPERATAASCFGATTTTGERTVIPVAEIWYGVAMGWGSGETEKEGLETEGSGGGGGGGARSRGVAVIEVGPEGVRVHPILDQTMVALAGIAFATAAVAVTARMFIKLVRG